jgi:hypothetical protein
MKAKKNIMKEGKDFYIDPSGLLVLTEAFLKKRGTCCHNACRHCPYADCFCHKERPTEKKK